MYSVIEIPLTQDQIAIVDDCDAPLATYPWYAEKDVNSFYAVRMIKKPNGSRGTLYLHRAILNPPDGFQVDHINGNGLDNRRANLRLATHAQNQCNKKKRSDSGSPYKGVYLHKKNNNWCAYINTQGKKKHLGSFATAEEAARAFDAAAKVAYGEFACLNFE